MGTYDMAEDKARILYIDDDPVLARLGHKKLERAGYSVDIFNDRNAKE